MATRGINKVILIGHTGADPEVRHLNNGNAMATLSIATSEAWKDKQTGEKQERTEWHRVVCFSKLAEIVGEYVRKGTKIYVEGSLKTRKWQDAQGQDRYTTEIQANEIQMLDSKGSTPNNFESSPSRFAEESQSQTEETLEDDVPF